MRTKPLQAVHCIIVLSAIAVLNMSCATSKSTTGRPIDEAKISSIVDNKTTDLEVISWFGAPTSISSLGDRTIYLYKFCVTEKSGCFTGYYATSNAHEFCDELSIVFDTNKKVISHGYQKASR